MKSETGRAEYTGNYLSVTSIHRDAPPCVYSIYTMKSCGKMAKISLQGMKDFSINL